MGGQSPKVPPDRLISELAERQHGVVSAQQLRSIGVSRRQIERRLRLSRLHPLHRGIYAVGTRGTTVAGWRVAALLASGTGAVLSHRTAGLLWRLGDWNDRVIDVTIPTEAFRRTRRGIRLHTAPLPPAELTRRDGFPVTTVARTLLDLAAVITRRALERAVDEAERRRLLDPAALEAVLDSNRHRPGRPALAKVLATHTAGSTLTRSTLEEVFLALCREHGLPQPLVNAPVGPYFADFLWPEQRLIVETDEASGHKTRLAIEHDHERDAHLAVRGFRVVRYTETRILTAPEKVASELRVLLELAA